MIHSTIGQNLWLNLINKKKIALKLKCIEHNSRTMGKAHFQVGNLKHVGYRGQFNLYIANNNKSLQSRNDSQYNSGNWVSYSISRAFSVVSSHGNQETDKNKINVSQLFVISLFLYKIPPKI